MSASDVPPDLALLIASVQDRVVSNYYAYAGLVMFIYDLILTFPTEVEKIWKHRFGVITALWFMNRWVYLVGLAINYVAVTDWFSTSLICSRFHLFAGLFVACMRIFQCTIFWIRLYCLYDKRKSILFPLGASFAAEFVIKTYVVIAFGAIVPLPPGIPGCVLGATLAGADKLVVYWVIELFNDSIVLALTIYRSYAVYLRESVRPPTLLVVILHDEILYFMIMCLCNLATIISYMTVPMGLRALNTSFGAVLTSLLVSRIILNLRVAASRGDHGEPLYGAFNSGLGGFETIILGNLEDPTSCSTVRRDNLSTVVFAKSQNQSKFDRPWP